MPAYNECEGEYMNFWERNLNANEQHSQNRQSNNIYSKNNASNNQNQGGQYSSNQHQNFNVMEHIARLGSMSEEDRLHELTKTASSMKQQGAFNIQDLERVYQTAGMFMSADQLARLRTLIDMLKQ